jgi:hypothetical protein
MEQMKKYIFIVISIGGLFYFGCSSTTTPLNSESIPYPSLSRCRIQFANIPVTLIVTQSQRHSNYTIDTVNYSVSYFQQQGFSNNVNWNVVDSQHLITYKVGKYFTSSDPTSHYLTIDLGLVREHDSTYTISVTIDSLYQEYGSGMVSLDYENRCDFSLTGITVPNTIQDSLELQFGTPELFSKLSFTNSTKDHHLNPSDLSYADSGSVLNKNSFPANSRVTLMLYK